MAKQAISATLDKQNIYYLDELAKRHSIPRSEVLDSIIHTQYVKWLEKEMREGAISQGPEDIAMAEEGMNDYLNIIKHSERDEK